MTPTVYWGFLFCSVSESSLRMSIATNLSGLDVGGSCKSCLQLCQLLCFIWFVHCTMVCRTSFVMRDQEKSFGSVSYILRCLECPRNRRYYGRYKVFLSEWQEPQYGWFRALVVRVHLYHGCTRKICSLEVQCEALQSCSFSYTSAQHQSCFYLAGN